MYNFTLFDLFRGYIYLIGSKKKNVKVKWPFKITKQTFFEGNNRVGNYSVIVDSYIGFATYIGPSAYIIKALIGKFCSIGRGFQVIAGNHPSRGFVSTHPSFFSTAKQAGFTYVTESLFDEYEYIDSAKLFFIKIGSDVWIGDNVMIKAGITIGDGAIIATGAIVNKDVAPYTIVGGVPAKFIRNRFEDSEIRVLQKIKWWNKSSEWTFTNRKYFVDIKLFCEKFNNNI